MAAIHGGQVWLGQQALKTCSISNRVIEQVRLYGFQTGFILTALSLRLAQTS
jgi:hypothetical protein